MSEPSRVDARPALCIGLDGATLDVALPLVEAGLLPNLAGLMVRGSWGRLRSTLPPLSPPAWASFATGVNPGAHGVFDFVSRRPDGQFTVANGSTVEAPKLWDLAGAAGRRVGVINVPLTYPPRPVNGFLISGMDAPRKSVATTYPPELAQRIAARFGTYWVERHTGSLLPQSQASFTRRYVAATLEMTRRRGEVAAWLLAEEAPDLLIVVFYATDRLQHLQGETLASIAAARGDVERWASTPAVLAYRACDDEIGRLMAAAGAETNVIVMSDHGFQPYQRVFSINAWLQERGYLVIDPARIGSGPAGPLARVVKRGKRMLGLGGEDGAEPGALGRFLGAIDWPHTRAFSFGAFGSVYLHMPAGEPTPGQGKTLVHEIAEGLLAYRDLETGVAPVVRAVPAAEAYRGPASARGPDLLLETAPGYFIRSSLDTYERALVAPVGRYQGRQLPHTGMHHPDGLLVMAGPDVQSRGEVAETPNIIDLAPTLLHLSGVAVPAEMEGRVLEEWLQGRSVAPRSPFVEGADVPEPAEGGEVYSPAEEAALAEHLRRLGYL